MGAWGEGPLDNDDALDFLISVRKEVDQNDFLDSKELVDKYLGKCEKGPKDITVCGQEYWATQVMAYAAWFHKEGFDISGYSNIISQAIDIAVLNANNSEIGWNNPTERIKAMAEFREQLSASLSAEKVYKYKSVEGIGGE